MDSRFRGNDINCLVAVIPAKAGIHTAYPNTDARPGVDSGVRLSPSFECLEQLLVEIVGNDETALVDTENGALFLNRHETCDGTSRAGDDNLISSNYMPQ